MKKIRIFMLAALASASFTETSCKKQVDAIISADKTTVAVNEIVTFTNSSSNASTYEWDFGDGKTSTERSPTHSWSSPGIYTVKMKGCPKVSHGPQQHLGGDKCDEASISITVN